MGNGVVTCCVIEFRLRSGHNHLTLKSQNSKLSTKISKYRNKRQRHHFSTTTQVLRRANKPGVQARDRDVAVGAGVAGQHLDAGGRLARGVDVGRLHGAARTRGGGIREPGTLFSSAARFTLLVTCTFQHT